MTTGLSGTGVENGEGKGPDPRGIDRLLRAIPVGALRRTAWAGAGVFAAGVVAFALVSPWILSRLSGWFETDWKDLSEVAQTYEGASAVLSAVALLGVSWSLVVQARQLRGQRIQIVRELHFELTRMALDDPQELLPCWRPIPVATLEAKRQHVYQNLVFSYFWMLFELSDLPEEAVREIARAQFKGTAARLYWEAVQGGWTPTFFSQSTRHRRLRYRRIVDEAYDRAKEEGSPTTPPRFEWDRRGGGVPHHQPVWTPP